jgi:glycosyltransferase involved in cell wall biosynthesis
MNRAATPGRSPAVCLVTSTHIAANPRLVKEADALANAGYRVRVAAMNVLSEQAALDQALLAGRAWTLATVNAQRHGAGRARWLFAALRQQLCLRVAHRLNARALRPRAYSRFAPELARLAASEPADLYLGHTLAALPAAAWAARRRGTKLGFDAEDFQSGIRAHHAPRTLEDRLGEQIEAEYLPLCDHLTSASPGVSDALTPLCGGRRPEPVLNVFPLTHRPAQRPVRTPGGPLRLYWFSQVIGMDRGLEDAVSALRELPSGSAELHLRGRSDDAARRYVARLVSDAGLPEHAVVIHAPAPPEQMVALAGEHDVGLALEVPASPNRLICMNDLCTNKVFTYLMAGLALAATAVRPQAGVYEGAGFTYVSGDARALAAGLRRWLDDPAALQRARQSAWDIATRRYNWECEQTHLLTALARVLPLPAR